MRRKFTDTLKSLPKELRSRAPAQTGLDLCNRLFALEAEFSQQALSAEQQYAQRKQKSEPIAEEFFRWAQTEYEKNPVPKSLYGAALGYASRQQSWLMHVFCGGRLELSKFVGRYWLSACGALAAAALLRLVPEGGMIALLLLAYTPVLVLVPLLETLGIGEISPMMAAVGMFCLCNWLICRCFVRKK